MDRAVEDDAVEVEEGVEHGREADGGDSAGDGVYEEKEEKEEEEEEGAMMRG
jgi:hypothetical protein